MNENILNTVSSTEKKATLDAVTTHKIAVVLLVSSIIYVTSSEISHKTDDRLSFETICSFYECVSQMYIFIDLL